MYHRRNAGSINSSASSAGEMVFPLLGSRTAFEDCSGAWKEGEWGTEVDLELKDVIRRKLGLDYDRWTGENYSLEERTGARNLRKTLQTKVRQQRSVTS